ncbi:Protein mahjong, partial [Pseudolycoriella hygida]
TCGGDSVAFRAASKSDGLIRINDVLAELKNETKFVVNLIFLLCEIYPAHERCPNENTTEKQVADSYVGRHIYDLRVNKDGTQIALVENLTENALVRESAVRLYTVGMRNVDEENDDSPNENITSDTLLEIKTPITDADCIRGMACRALIGLARSETFRQDIGKFRLLTKEKLQSLMIEPILQSKRTEHAQFRKYALELMELLFGTARSSSQLDSLLSNRVNVVGQTRIQRNDQQLFDLIHKHLEARGMHETAASLQREAGLTTKNATNKPLTQHSRSANTSLMRMRPSDFDAALSATESPPHVSTKNNQSDDVILDFITAEYLANQHDLFAQHKCPDPSPNKVQGLCPNFAGRYFHRQAGFNSSRLDRRLVHSQFRMSCTIPSEVGAYFTCCDFTPCTTRVVVGLNNGKVKVFNDNARDVSTYDCHDYYVTNVKCSKDGTLLLTSRAWFPLSSKMWKIEENQLSLKLLFNNEQYLDFSKLCENYILGSHSDTTTIYDVETGKRIKSFFSPNLSTYTHKMATFCPSDNLILSGSAEAK